MMWLAHAILATSIAAPSKSAENPASFGCVATHVARSMVAHTAASGVEPQDAPTADSGGAHPGAQPAKAQAESAEEPSASETKADSKTIPGETFQGQPIADFSLSTFEPPASNDPLTWLLNLGKTAPDDAVPLELSADPIYVPPHGTAGWDFDVEGRPVFIVRDVWNRLVWRRCDRELTPLETRVIPGLPTLIHLPQHGKGPETHHDAIYLGQDRWWLAVSGGFAPDFWQLRPTIYDSSTNRSVPLDQLSAWLGAESDWQMEAYGDGLGGVLVASHGTLLSIDAAGQLRWRLTPDASADDRNGFRLNNESRIVLVTSDGEIVLHAYGDSRIDVLGADGEWLRSLEPTSDHEGLQLRSAFALGPHQLLLTWVQARRSSRSGKLIITGPRELSSAIDVRQGNRIEPVIGDALRFGESRHGKPNFYILQDWKSDGAVWRAGTRSLARTGGGGEVLERLASPKSDQVVNSSWLVTLLANGSAIVPDPEVLHIWSPDGPAVHATEQAAPSRFEVATDANGAVWLSPVDYRGVSSGPAVGWAADGAVLGELFTGGRLAFDPSGRRVWSCEAIEDQGNTLRLFDLDGTLLAEHAMYRVDETEMPIEKVRALSVNDEGLAALWLAAEKGSRLVRFGPEGQQLGVWEFASLIPSDQPAGQHGDWILATRTGLIFEDDVIVDLSDPDSPRYASVEDLVDWNAESFGFSPDGTELWLVFDSPLSLAKRPLDKLRWRKL